MEGTQTNPTTLLATSNWSHLPFITSITKITQDQSLYGPFLMTYYDITLPYFILSHRIIPCYVNLSSGVYHPSCLSLSTCLFVLDFNVSVIVHQLSQKISIQLSSSARSVRLSQLLPSSISRLQVEVCLHRVKKH